MNEYFVDIQAGLIDNYRLLNDFIDEEEGESEEGGERRRLFGGGGKTAATLAAVGLGYYGGRYTGDAIREAIGVDTLWEMVEVAQRAGSVAIEVTKAYKKTREVANKVHDAVVYTHYGMHIVSLMLGFGTEWWSSRKGDFSFTRGFAYYAGYFGLTFGTLFMATAQATGGHVVKLLGSVKSAEDIGKLKDYVDSSPDFLTAFEDG